MSDPATGYDYRTQVQMEHVFNLVYYLRFSYSDAMSLPIQKRMWFIRRLQDEIKRRQEAGGMTESIQDQLGGL